MADTLMYYKKLEAAGFSRQQAEVQIEMMNEFTTGNFATKEDLKDLAQSTKQALKDLAQSTKQDFKDLEHRMDTRFIHLENELTRMSDRLTIRLGGVMIIGFSALAAFIKLV